jgi:hypothetical protein
LLNEASSNYYAAFKHVYFLLAEQKSYWSDYYSNLIFWMFWVEILGWKMAILFKIIHGVPKSFKAIGRMIPPIPYTLITLSFDTM